VQDVFAVTGTASWIPEEDGVSSAEGLIIFLNILLEVRAVREPESQYRITLTVRCNLLLPSITLPVAAKTFGFSMAVHLLYCS
jgi:hypothetical protein